MKAKTFIGTFCGMTSAIVAAVLLVGCAQEAVVAQRGPLNKWVQRDVVITSPDFEITSSEFVGVDSAFYKAIGPEERVIWIAGVNPKTSKLQRNGLPVDTEKMQTLDDARDGMVSSNVFGLSNNDLSVEAMFAVDAFKANVNDRFYAEILNTGSVKQESVEGGMLVWKDLLNRLQKKGLNLKNVTFGGTKYHQEINAIVLVKVGS